jgi:hypothetical protein
MTVALRIINILSGKQNRQQWLRLIITKWCIILLSVTISRDVNCVITEQEKK